jgi:uracil-DNA glycosylase
VILVVGESPAKGREDQPPIVNGCRSGETWKTWCTTLGIDPASCSYVNVYCPDGSVSEEFSSAVEKLSYMIIITLGEKAKKNVLRVRNSGVVCLPHPSGLNRKLNNKAWLTSELQGARGALEKLMNSFERRA